MLRAEQWKIHKFYIAQVKSLDVFFFKSVYLTSEIKSFFVQNKISV